MNSLRIRCQLYLYNIMLKPHIENIEDLIETGDVQEVLDVIDDVIVDNILANNDEPDDEGVKLQKIYDEIFNQN